jgi:hypothetical protein
MGLFNRHKHDWELLRVEYGESFEHVYATGATVPQGPITWGYWKCRTCHKTRLDKLDRERAITAAQNHFARGDLSLSEFEHQLDNALVMRFRG